MDNIYVIKLITMYRIKYNKETKYYTVTNNGQHCISSYDYQRCVDYVTKLDRLTYVNYDFTSWHYVSVKLSWQLVTLDSDGILVNVIYQLNKVYTFTN